MTTLTREELTSGRTLKHEVVTVPDLGDVNVYEMSPRQRMDFAKWAVTLMPEGQDPATFDPPTLDVLSISDYREQVLVRTIRDDAGKLMYGSEDVALLGDMLSEDALTLLCGTAVELSGLTDAAIEKRADGPNSPDASAS